MVARSVSWIPRSLLALMLLTQRGTTDCELCQSIETGVTSVSFEIESIDLNNDIENMDLNPFIRMQIEKEFINLDYEKDPELGLTVNDEQSTYEGCFSATEKQLVKQMGDVHVIFMNRSTINEESQRCIGYQQLSVRVAPLPNNTLMLEEDGIVNVQWQGPSKVKEVCVGMEGGNCTIRGNGESHRRCFVRPSMPDNCEVSILSQSDTIVVTSGDGFVSNDSSLFLFEFDEVYVGSMLRYFSATLSDIRVSTTIELMSEVSECGYICDLDEIEKSKKDVSLIHTSNTTLNLVGFGRQSVSVSAVGNTSVSAFVLNDYLRNRITINARCSQGLNLRYFIQGAKSEHFDFWNRWSMRVGCPDGHESKKCRITDVGESRAKHVIIATREAWLDDLIYITGNRLNSFISTYAAFYKSERSEECCRELCDFKKHCPLASQDRGRSFTYDKFCNSFVLSFYVPFVHILTAVVYLICVGSLFMLVCRDDRIQSSKNIKLITLSLCQSALFAVTWIVITFIDAVQHGDMFQDVSQTRRGTYLFGSLLSSLLIGVQCFIATDSRSLQFALIKEINDKVLVEKGTESWIVYNSQNDLSLHGWGIKMIGFFFPLAHFIYFFRPVYWDVIVALFWVCFLIASIVYCMAVCKTLKSLPDFSFLLGMVLFVAFFYEVGPSMLLIIVVVASHFWNFLVVWAMVLQFAYGETVMLDAKKAALYLLIQSVKITRLFTQILDVFTDWTIIAFFFADGWVLFGLTESTFVLSAAMVSAYYEWDSFPHWWQRMITLMGLGRIIQVIDNSVSLKTRTFLSEIEVHLESLPSVLFGMLIVLTTPREDSGPVLFSMSVTWFSLFLRAMFTVIKPKMPVVWKGLIFLTLFSDFFVRCVSPALMVSLIQGQNGEEWTMWAILPMLLYFVSVLAAYLVYYWNFYSGAVSRSPFYLRAMISTISVRCALFAYLRMDHYKHDAVIATPVDFAVLTLPHCFISLAFSSISILYLWDVFPGLSIVSVLITLIQMGCVIAMCILSKDEFISVDADQLPAKENPPIMHEVVTSMSDVLSPVEDNPDSSPVKP